ncbi:MAG TPA: hypothetical protein VLC73_10985 [Burkholderiales bacterium]|nr:hypothetical protein [Burkholderiales bacterium]
MRFLPQHPVIRLVATAWLLASVVMLTVTLLRPDITGNDRAALVYLTPLYWLSFPLGHAGVLAGIRIRLELYLEFNFVPSILSEGLYLWTALTALGYLQWFVLLPVLAQKCRQLADFLSRRSPAR